MDLRRVLFGYTRDYDGFHILEQEAETVKDIFSLYLSGYSLKNIADYLTEQKIIYFQDKTTWNKNMVKRIIDNSVYCGNDNYPEIINEEIFTSAQKIKTESCSYSKEATSPEIDFLKSRVICSQCSGRVIRKKQKNGQFRWLCENQCKTGVKVYDQSLISALNACVTQIKNNPDNISPTHSAEVDGYSPSPAVTKLEKDINRLLEQKELSFKNISKLLIDSVSEKYACCSFVPDMDYISEICRLLNDYTRSSNDTSILEQVIYRVKVEKSGDISISFRNNAEWHNNQEK